MCDLYNFIESEIWRIKGVKVFTALNEMGMNHSNLYDLKNGKKKTLSAKTLGTLSKYLGVSESYILHMGKKSPGTEDDVEAKERGEYDDSGYSPERRELLNRVANQLTDEQVSHFLALIGNQSKD